MKIGLIISSLLVALNSFGQTTVFTDSFNGTFPGSWIVGNDGGISGTLWGNNSAKSTGDGWSAFCADNGNNSAATYPNNLHTYMERRNVSLAGFSSATLSFKYTGSTETSLDYFTVNIRNQSGSWSEVFRKSGNTSAWVTQTIDVSQYCGQTGLYVQFRFDSNRKTTSQGIWVDDVSLTGASATSVSQIDWSGYTWSVKSGKANPGPNNWLANSSSVWVDANQNLHLKIRKIGTIWYSSEIYLSKSLGYGQYSFEVSTNVETLDKNIVLGLFTYETDTREIDIEFARWGVATNPAAQYVLQPSSASSKYSFPLNLTGSYSTHRFTWSSSEIFFQSLNGHGTDLLINQWMYKGAYNPPAGNEKVHLNLWLYQGKAPSNLQEAEVVIKSFTFKPLQPAIALLSPKGGENWIQGSTQFISWTSTLIPGTVKIEIDRNYPSVWETLMDNAANDGSEPWLVTGNAGNAARIRISSSNNPAISGLSAGNFSIVSSGGVIPLMKCIPVPDLSAVIGASSWYMITVPPGATNLTINTSGGTGDCDLYVKKGQKPTTSVYDYRSWAAGNAGSVTIASPSAGDYYITLYAYAAYTGATLTACYTGLGMNPLGPVKSAMEDVSAPGMSDNPDILTVYPNPAHHQVTIGFESKASVMQNLEIINTLGQVVYFSASLKNNRSLESTIDISSLPDGLYYVRLVTLNGIKASRFIKN